MGWGPYPGLPGEVTTDHVALRKVEDKAERVNEELLGNNVTTHTQVHTMFHSSTRPSLSEETGCPNRWTQPSGDT